MGRKTLAGRGGLAGLGVLLVLALALAGLVGCGGSEDQAGRDDLPASPEEADSVVFRVSGTEGTAYLGDYGAIAADISEEPEIIEDTLADEPVEYEVEDASGGVSGLFQKTQPGGEKLTVEILADGGLVAESTTYAELGTVIVDWAPQIGPPPDDVSPEEGP